MYGQEKKESIHQYWHNYCRNNLCRQTWHSCRGIIARQFDIRWWRYEEKNKNNTLEYTVRYRVYRQCFNQSKYARLCTYEADAGQMGRYCRDDLQRGAWHLSGVNTVYYDEKQLAASYLR